MNEAQATELRAARRLQSVCAACRERNGNPAIMEDFGDDPLCAFGDGGDYNPSNWNCATINLLRDFIGPYNANEQKRVDFRAWNVDADTGDTQYATIELPDLEELHPREANGLAMALWVTWYKRRGATGEMWILYDDAPAKRPTEKEMLLIIRALTGNSVVGLS